jgi:hypothetical protein
MQTKKRVEYYIHDDDFHRLQEIVKAENWKSVSELIRHIIEQGKDPGKLQKKKRNLTIDAEGIEKIKKMAEDQFNGNQSEALNFLITKYLKS